MESLHSCALYGSVKYIKLHTLHAELGLFYAPSWLMEPQRQIRAPPAAPVRCDAIDAFAKSSQRSRCG